MFTLNCRGRLIVIDKPLVMGIINATPDSFFQGSRFQSIDSILFQSEKILQEGGAFIDIGGQSTRPGSKQVSADEELSRLIPAIGTICEHFPEAVISVDTYYSRVARESVAAGAAMINDISGGTVDKHLVNSVAELKVPYICMHMKGTPETMHHQPAYTDVSKEVLDYLIIKTDACQKAGINDIIIDPGFGFSKNATHNLRLLKDLSLFAILNRPVMAGISRKSTIYKSLGVTAEEALNGTTVLNTICLLKGASILRVHDVREAKEAIKLVGDYLEA